MNPRQNGHLPDLVGALYRKAESEIRVYPCHANRASSLGGDCERQLVYERVAWEQKAPHDVGLELIFREGSNQERQLLADLAAAGVEVLEQQVPLEWREFQLTGHVDGVVVVNNQAVPLEIKSMAAHIWDTVATRGPGVYEWSEVAPAFTKKPWLRRYYGQLLLYCLCKNAEHGILLCKNKSTGAIAQINVALDMDYAEELLQRASRINDHVAAKTLPDRIEYNEEVCGKCPFLSLCLPDCAAGPPIAFVSDDAVAQRLDERAAAAEAGKAFYETDAWIKEWFWAKFPEGGKATVGSWFLEGKVKSGRRYLTITALPVGAIQ